MLIIENILYKLKSFALVFTADIPEEKLQQAVGEIMFPTIFSYIPWGHHILIITKCKTLDKTIFYIKRTIVEGLSRKALLDYIEADLYNHTGKAITNFKETLPLAHGKLATIAEARAAIIALSASIPHLKTTKNRP